MINYRKSSEVARAAYFKWRKSTQENWSVVSFLAGYNAALNDNKKENEKK